MSGDPLDNFNLVKDALRIGYVHLVIHKVRHLHPTLSPMIVREMLPQALRDILHGDPRLLRWHRSGDT